MMVMLAVMLHFGYACGDVTIAVQVLLVQTSIQVTVTAAVLTKDFCIHTHHKSVPNVGFWNTYS